MKENGPRGLTISWNLIKGAVPTGEPVYYVAIVSYVNGTNVTQKSVTGKIFFYDSFKSIYMVTVISLFLWKIVIIQTTQVRGVGWVVIVIDVYWF